MPVSISSSAAAKLTQLPTSTGMLNTAQKREKSSGAALSRDLKRRDVTVD
jgi:hypothetical protein